MKRLRLSVVIVLSIAIGVAELLPLHVVYAGKLNQRSVALANSTRSAVTTHSFSFSISSPDALGSIVFEYCQNDPLADSPCTVPPGLDLYNATLDTQTGIAGFGVSPATTTNRLVLSRSPSAPTPGDVIFVIGNVVNPSVTGTEYVRISTYNADDGTGIRIDDGGVAYSIADSISTQAYVPPFLVFCSAVSVSVDCSSASGFYVDLGELRPNQASTGQSQYSGATNDVSGYTVSIFGNTLTAGNQVIPASVTPTGSTSGTSQFGINLRANSNPPDGQDPGGVGSSVPTVNYAVANRFMYASGDTLSSSSQSTDYNRFTVTYLANVSAAQPAGIYTSTFTFIAVASF